MKALSLWQPWASAIAAGAKRIETRSWRTSYRGPLAIHAAKRCVWDELCHYHCSWNWTGALWTLDWGMKPGCTKEWSDKPFKDKLPFGAIVAVCELVCCRPTDDFMQHELDTVRMPENAEAAHIYAWTERMMGDFSLGRFGWVLVNVRAIKPIPYQGGRGLFNVPDGLLEAA